MNISFKPKGMHDLWLFPPTPLPFCHFCFISSPISDVYIPHFPIFFFLPLFYISLYSFHNISPSTIPKHLFLSLTLTPFKHTSCLPSSQLASCYKSFKQCWSKHRKHIFCFKMFPWWLSSRFDLRIMLIPWCLHNIRWISYICIV